MSRTICRRLRVPLIALFGVASALSALICVGIGTVHFTLLEIFRALFVEDDSTARLLIWHLRFPRVLCGGLVGVCLSLSGCILQGVMRNTMASPSTIGVTGGASFVGYVTLVAFPQLSSLLPVGSILGAFNDIIKTFFADSLGNASGFLVGGMNGASWSHFRMILPYALTGVLLCFLLPSKMNILMLGDETANSLGLRTEGFRFFLIAVSSLLVL